MNRASIEAKSIDLLDEICRWEQCHRRGALSRMQMLEPERVADHLEYDVVFYDSLGTWGRGADRFEIGGVLDQQRKRISISLAFSREAGRFTAAHEIGHIVLGHPGTIIHRERPIFEITDSRREAAEREADYFAACLLIPRSLLERAFARRFGEQPLWLDDNVAFHLCGRSAHGVMRAGPRSYEFASAVATARRFNGVQFRSLADAFNVSTSAMAHRLQELGFLGA